MKKIFHHWKIIYTICSLLYIGWVIHVGGNEFDRINSQYRAIAKELEPGRIRNAALVELSAECRREEARGRIAREEDGCYSWPDQAVEAKGKEIEERLLRAKQRGAIKVVLFYAGFVVIFLLGPPALIYLLIAGTITLYKNIKIVR